MLLGRLDLVLFTAAGFTAAPPQGNANKYVKALNASSGEILWTYQPDMPVWNFLALFPDDGSLVFQDMSGKAYRLTLEGQLMWKAGRLAQGLLVFSSDCSSL